MAKSIRDELDELMDSLTLDFSKELSPAAPKPKPMRPRVTMLSHKIREAPILVRPPAAFTEAPGTFFSLDNQLPAEIWKLILSHCHTFKPKEILDFMEVCGFWYHSIRYLDDFWHEKFYNTFPLDYLRLDTNVLRSLRDPEPPNELDELFEELVSGKITPQLPFTGVVDWYFLFMNYSVHEKREKARKEMEAAQAKDTCFIDDGLWLAEGALQPQPLADFDYASLDEIMASLT